jgi:hypothetical protein
MMISRLFLAVSKVLPQRFRRRLPKVRSLILLKLPANSRNLPVVKGPSRRILLPSLIITHPTLRINIMVRRTIPDMFLSLSSSTQLCFSLDPLGQDPLETLPRNSPVMLVFSLRQVITGVCINKQDTTIIRPIHTRSTNNTNTLTALVWAKA